MSEDIYERIALGLDLMDGNGGSMFVFPDAEDQEAYVWRWVESGFTLKTAKPWWEADGFEPEACAQLRDAGITPDQAKERISLVENGFFVMTTVVSALCDGLITLRLAIEIINDKGKAE